MAEVPGGVMNSVGLQNPSVAALPSSPASRPHRQGTGHLPGRRSLTEEYVRALEMFVELCPGPRIRDQRDCPNIAAGGAACGSTRVPPVMRLAAR
ncbi:MAG: hypothetical protein ACLTKG_02420 [Collinsella intestinalis]